MPVLTYVAIAAHLLVLYRGCCYFWGQRDGRDNDRHLVAATMAGSGLYLLSLIPVYVGVAPGLAAIVTPMGAAFAIFNAAFYAIIIQQFVEGRAARRESHG